MTAPCWVTRLEAMGYEDLSDACQGLTPAEWEVIDRVAAARLAGADCGWDKPPAEGQLDGCYNGYCWCRAFVLEAMCVLDEGHAGPHEFDDQRDIILEFAPAPSTAQADHYWPVGAEQGAPRRLPGDDEA